MDQLTFWKNLYFGFFYIIGENYLFAIMAFIILFMLIGAFIKKFLTTT